MASSPSSAAFQYYLQKLIGNPQKVPKKANLKSNKPEINFQSLDHEKKGLTH